MNEELRTILKVRQALDESARRCAVPVQDRLNLAIANAMAVHAQKLSDQPAQVPAPRQPKPLVTPGHALGELWNGVIQWVNQPALSFAVSAAFVVTAVTGIVHTGEQYYDAKLTEVANLDAEILGDDLPPSAYVDSGFVGYTSQEASQELLQTDDQINQWMDSIPAPQPAGGSNAASTPTS